MKYLFYFIFFKKAHLYVRGGKFKEWNAKNRNKKSSFFNAISLEYKATKFPQDYMEREKSQTCLTREP